MSWLCGLLPCLITETCVEKSADLYQCLHIKENVRCWSNVVGGSLLRAGLPVMPPEDPATSEDLCVRSESLGAVVDPAG